MLLAWSGSRIVGMVGVDGSSYRWHGRQPVSLVWLAVCIIVVDGSLYRRRGWQMVGVVGSLLCWRGLQLVSSA